MSQFITPSIDAPGPRNLTQELTKAHKAQLHFAPQDYQLEAKYGPLYNRLDIKKAGENLLGFTDRTGAHPGTLALSGIATGTQRERDVSDVERLGGRASAAILRANPYLRGALDRLNARMTDSPILSELNQEAQDTLRQGGELSPQEINQLGQSSRALFAGRGTAMGNQSIGAELLSRDAAVRARRAAGQAFAGQVQQLNQGQNDFVARGTQIDASVLSDPFMAILGRPSTLAPTAAIPGSGQVYNPPNYLGYAQDLFNTNYNAGVNLGIAQSNAQAGTRAAIASIAGAGIGASDKRIKKNIRSVGKDPEGNPLKEWTYRTDPANRRWRGYMAQDLEKRRPDAVITDPVSGLKAVNYDRMPVKMALADMIDIDMKEAA